MAREPRGELDATIVLYTKDLGKILAFAKSIRKITSKLSGHLVPGKIADIRVVENNGSGYQVVDALSFTSASTPEVPRLLSFIDRMSPSGVQDLQLWYEIENSLQYGITGDTYRKLLLIMGLGGEEIGCEKCGNLKIAYFLPLDVIFLCAECFKRLGIEEKDGFQI